MTVKTILLIVIVMAVAIVIYKYLHKKHIRYNQEDLEKSIRAIFERQGADTMGKSDLLRELKRTYRCMQKDAVTLVGAACKYGIIVIDGKEARLQK